MSNPLFDIDIKRDGNKVVIDYMNYVNEISRKINRELERLSAADFDLFAHKLGYVKVAPDEVVVKRATAEGCLESLKGLREIGALDGPFRIEIDRDAEPAAFADLERALEEGHETYTNLPG